MSRSDAIVTVYAAASYAPLARDLLGIACRAAGAEARLDLGSSGALFQRLRTEQDEPVADLLLGGPLLAETAAREELLGPWSPAMPAVTDLLVGAPRDGRWLPLGFAPFVVAGVPPASSLEDLRGGDVSRLALLDPRRTESGMFATLAILDRARQAEGDAERGWTWLNDRVARGVSFQEAPGGTAEAVRSGASSHALLLRAELPEGLAPVSTLRDLAPIPVAVGLVTKGPHPELAGALLEALLSEQARRALAARGFSSALPPDVAALRALVPDARPFDVEWAYQQYNRVRAEWKRKPLPTA